MAAGDNNAFIYVFIMGLTFSLTSGCGTTTHIEISRRALEHFADQKGQFTYQQLLRKHQDAFQAGSPYPDAYYPDICAGGKYHDISEDSHWTPFLNATLNYIRMKYPPPWDEATEKLVVFMFGFMSHQVADVLWHNLDISQGFLQTMAYMNFNGVYDTAHTAGDIGGDVLTEFEMNLNQTVDFSDWYVPIDDLVNIYRDLYGRDRMPKDIMEACIATLFLERLGEQLAIGEVFTTYAKKSPFLVDQFTNYFVGGIDDMSAWTQIIWKHVVYMLEHGQSECNVTHNALYITCDRSPQSTQVVHRKPARESGIPMRLSHHGLSRDDIIVEKAYRGKRFRATDKLKEFMHQKQHKKHGISKLHQTESSNEKQPDAVYTVPEKYAKLGWSLAVGDLNDDGQDDLAIGAPGYGSEVSPQDGKVFIIYGTDNGLPLKTMDNLNAQANQVLDGPFMAQARFGSSIAIVDINMDGINDIAVGAPNMGSESTPLKYQGVVYVYYGSRDDMYRFSQVNMTINCKDTFCNNGWSLSAGDLNGDGHPDLLLGSPFAPGGGQQRGFIGTVYASKKYSDGVTTLAVDSLDWTYSGQQDYGWFGQDMSVRQHPSGQQLLLVSQPTFRNCSLYNCSYDVNDTQSVGRLNVFRTPLTRASLPATRSGSHHFQMFGSSLDVGHPLPGGDTILAVSAVGEDVEGKVLLVGTDFTQAGSVHLLNITNIASLPQQQVAVYAGDRRYSRFGAKVKFADLDTDGYDDLIITAPLRTEDVTEELYGAEEGRVFIFNGGKGFLMGHQALYDCKALSIEPCPGQKASYELKIGEDGARFGTNIAVVKSKHTVNLVVSALHSSRGDRLAGAVVLYSFSKS